MSEYTLSNAAVIAGEGTSRAAGTYRVLVRTYGHDTLCDAYGLDRDGVNGGTFWADIVRQAVMHGDVNPETGELA